MLSLSTRIAGLLERLRDAIAAHAARNRALQPMLVLAWSYLGRTSARFLALYDKWQKGTLKPPRPHRPRPTPAPETKPEPRPQPRPWQRLPRRHGWLIRDEPLLNNFATGLRHELLQPDMQEFLAAVPRAKRLLRPVLHMLGWPIADTVLALPPRPPRPKPVRPPKPPPEPRRDGKYPRFNYDTYSPGKIPPFRRPNPA
jgi:hypothetical protein